MVETEIRRAGPLAKTAHALRERLELVFPGNLFTHQWMPSRVDRKVWMELIRRTPMIGVGFSGFQKPETTGGLNVISRWMVYAVTQNQSGNEAVLFGDKMAPGQLDLAEVASAVLHGHTIQGIGSIQLIEAANSYVEDYEQAGLSITAIELTVPVDLSLHEVLGGRATHAADLIGEMIAWSFDGATFNDNVTIPRGNT